MQLESPSDQRRGNLEWLTGSWRVERTISDGSRGSGSAVIEKIAERAYAFEEQLTLTLPSGETVRGCRAFRLEVETKELIWRFADGPDAGNIFQRFPVTAASSESSHRCGDDLYRSILSWSGDHGFEVHHEVAGPAKNYSMHTRYHRD